MRRTPQPNPAPAPAPPAYPPPPPYGYQYPPIQPPFPANSPGAPPGAYPQVQYQYQLVPVPMQPAYQVPPTLQPEPIQEVENESEQVTSLPINSEDQQAHDEKSEEDAPPVRAVSRPSHGNDDETKRFMQTMMTTYGKRIIQRSQHVSEQANDLVHELRQFIQHLEHRGMQTPLNTNDLYNPTTSPDDVERLSENLLSLLDTQGHRGHGHTERKQAGTHRGHSRQERRTAIPPNANAPEISREEKDARTKRAVERTEAAFDGDGMETAFSAQVVSFLKSHIMPRLESVTQITGTINYDVSHMASDITDYVAGRGGHEQ